MVDQSKRINMEKKIKNKVSIEVYDNGCAVTIKRGKENLGAKVFEGKDNIKRSSKWIEEVCKKE